MERKMITINLKSIKVVGLFIKCFILLCLSIKITATELPTHYIVLFDGSGSMKSDYRYNFWESSSSNMMAEKLSGLVNSSIEYTQQVEAIPDYKQGDYISFALFNVGYRDASFETSEMFYSNKELALSKGLPNADYYERFQPKDIEGRGTKVLSYALSGHSPIIAATSVALPYINSQIKERYKLPINGIKVGKIVIIRITDGTYNAKSNGSDEFTIISRTVGVLGGSVTGYDKYLDESQQADRLFEIGRVREDCYIKVTDLSRYDCGRSAFQSVTNKGQGFLVTYLSVMPKGPAIQGLVVNNNKTVYLERSLKNNKLYLEGTSRITALEQNTGSASTKLTGVEWNLAGQSPAPCGVTNGIVDCMNGTNIYFEQQQENPTAAYYYFDYERKQYLYPFAYKLPRFTEEVTLEPKPIVSEQNQIYPLPRPLDVTNLTALNPARLLRFGSPTIKPKELTDELFVSKALEFINEIGTDEGADTVSPPQLASFSVRQYFAYQEQERIFNIAAKVVYAILAILIIFAYLYWPRRKLAVEKTIVATEGLQVDFNHREYESIALVGSVTVNNVAKTRYHKPFDLAIRLGNTELQDGEDEHETVLLYEQKDSSLSLVKLEQFELTDNKAVTGKEYNLFFNPKKLVDLPIAANSEGIKLALLSTIKVDAGIAGTENIDIELPINFKPQASQLVITPPNEIKPDSNNRPVLAIDYRATEGLHNIGHYQLINDTQYQFSLSAESGLSVELVDSEGGSKLSTLYLVNQETGEQGDELEFTIAPKSRLVLLLKVDFSKLENPHEHEDYQVIVRKKLVEQDLWQAMAYWTLRVQRDTSRTEVSCQLNDMRNKPSKLLNTDKLNFDMPFEVGTVDMPLDIQIQLGHGRKQTSMFKLTLANNCHHGFGHAFWQAEVVITNARGLRFKDKSQAIFLRDASGEKTNNGQLKDSSKEIERMTNLAIVIDHDLAAFERRIMECQLQITVVWQICPDGKAPTNEFKHTMDIDCRLRHLPPQRAIAIDAGTSGYAIAYSAGPSHMELLNLQRILLARTSGDNTYNPKLESGDKNSSFISAECSVNLDGEQLLKMTPTDANFMVLPIDETAVARQPEKVFSGIKALFAAGYETLPYSPAHHPYLSSKGDNVERILEPPLDEVFEGIYRGLLTNYIKPALKGPHKGFSHVYLTHPNTYTPNHVAHLKQIAARVFAGLATTEQDIVYEDNIHFFSESDAVAFYYLIQTYESFGSDWSKVPNNEHVLVYDIGAGTLDLTFLKIEREQNVHGGKTPRKVKVELRGGISKAGHLLDECIARDLHDFLVETLEPQDYRNHIVTEHSEEMNKDCRYEMETLRQRIQQFKIDLSSGVENLKLKISRSLHDDYSIVKRYADETFEYYQQYDGIEANQRGEVFWCPTVEQVKAGKHVSGFIHQVTKREIDKFFGSTKPKINTVIVSGRTSLWPGFVDKLKATLGKVDHWHSFKGSAKELKQAVAMGVLECQFRWPDLLFEQPSQIGKFGIYYEQSGPKDWQFCEFDQSGQKQKHVLQDATVLDIGLQTNNGFFSCMRIVPAHYYDSSDKALEITLYYDESGKVSAKVRSSSGMEESFNEITNLTVLDYAAKPWPIGSSKLVASDIRNVLDDWE